VEFTVQPGEILFTTQREDLRPAVGTHQGSLTILLTAAINKVNVSSYFFHLVPLQTS
jgi:hypothetical protein